MAKRKINLQRIDRIDAESIDDIVKDLGTSDLGFVPTDQTIYEVELDRIYPDASQPRYLLPFDLREGLATGEITPGEAMAQLLILARDGNRLAMLILGDSQDIVDENSSVVEDKGLAALARSIQHVGLRQPINVYRVTDAGAPEHSFYRIGEGERRFWAHHLLVLQGHQEFSRIRCIIETLPDDPNIIQRRQQAENAARQDLSAMARARAVKQLRDRLQVEMGTRVPGENTIKLPTQREVDTAIGQEVKIFTGRAIGGRMVRNYLRLLNLSPELQDLAEAAQLTEKQLRPVLRLKSDVEQRQMIMLMIDQKLSGRAILSLVESAQPAASMRRVSRTSVEQRLEKRLFQAASAAYEVMSLGDEAYVNFLKNIVEQMEIDDKNTRRALVAIRQIADDLIGGFDGLVSNASGNRDVDLRTILPPMGLVRGMLPENYRQQFEPTMSGEDLMGQLLGWFRDDPLVASDLAGFVERINNVAEQIRSGEVASAIIVSPVDDEYLARGFMYRLVREEILYWAEVLLLLEYGESWRMVRVSLA